jgi:hypothetical protein
MLDAWISALKWCAAIWCGGLAAITVAFLLLIVVDSQHARKGP